MAGLSLVLIVLPLNLFFPLFLKLCLPMRRTKSTKVLEAMNPMTKAKQMMMELAMVLT